MARANVLVFLRYGANKVFGLSFVGSLTAVLGQLCLDRYRFSSGDGIKYKMNAERVCGIAA